MSRHGAPRERKRERNTSGQKENQTDAESATLLSLSFSLRLSLRGYAPFDALGDVHTIKQGNTRDKGGSKRTLRLGAQPSKLPPPRILRETYCLRISIFRATRQTHSCFSYPFIPPFPSLSFFSFRFHSLSSFLFFLSSFFPALRFSARRDTQLLCHISLTMSSRRY